MTDAIKLRQEPKGLMTEFREFREIELCCVCRTPTRMWTDLPDRTPGQQVACCKTCATVKAPAQVPTKAEWCDKEGRLTRRH